MEINEDERAYLEKKVIEKVKCTLEALKSLIQDSTSNKIQKFSYENVNIFILFLESFALEDAELKGETKKELIVKYFGEKDNNLIKNIRNFYMHREKIVLNVNHIQHFVFKGLGNKVNVRMFFENLTIYVQQILNKIKGAKHMNSIQLSNILQCSTTNIKKSTKTSYLSMLYKMLEYSCSENMNPEQREEAMYNFIVNFIPLTDGDFSSENLKNIRNQILHNFHKYEGLHSRFLELEQKLHHHRNQLFIFYCANKFYEWLLNIQSSEDPEEVEANVLKIMKCFDDKIVEFKIPMELESVFQNEVLLEFLVSRFVKKDRDRKMIPRNEHFIYMINKKLLKVKDAAPFLTKLMVVTRNCDFIEKKDLRYLVKTLLEHQAFRFVEHLNDFWYLKNNSKLIVDIIETADDQLKLEAAWVYSKMLIKETEHFQNEAVVSQAGPLPILFEIISKPFHTMKVNVMIQAVRVLGHLIKTLNYIIQQIIDCGFVPALVTLLDHDNVGVVQGAAIVAGYIAVGSFEQKQISIDHQPLDHGLLSHTSKRIRKEAATFLNGNNLKKEIIIQAGLLKMLVERLNSQDISSQTITVIHNLACGDNNQRHKIIDCGSWETIIPLLEHDNVDIQESAFVLAATIAAGSIEKKQFLFDHRSLDYLPVISSHTKETMLKKAKMFLRNIAVNAVEKEKVIQAGQFCKMFVESLNIRQTNNLTAPAWAIGEIAYDEILVENLIDWGFVPKLILLLEHIDVEVQEAALFALASLSSGNNDQKQALLDHRILTYVSTFLSHSKESIRKIKVQLLLMITSGNQFQKEAVIQAGILPNIFELLKDSSPEIKQVILMILIRITVHGSTDQFKKLIDEGAPSLLFSLLDDEDEVNLQYVIFCLNKLGKRANDLERVC